MAVKQIKSLVQFSRGNSLAWDALTTPIPDGVVVFSLDDGVFKLGNGSDNYQALLTLFTFNELVAAQGGASALFDVPTVPQNGEIVIAKLVGDTMKYAGSGTTLASLLSALTSLETQNGVQDTEIAALTALMLNVDANIRFGTNENLIVISGGKYADSGQTVMEVVAAANAAKTTVPGPHLEEPIFYTTADKVIEVGIDGMQDDTTYYCDVVGFHDGTDNPVFDLTTDNPNVTIANVADSLFSLTIAGATQPATNRPIILTASVDDGTGNSKVTKAIACEICHPDVLVSIYGGSNDEYYNDVIVDSADNIIGIGYTLSEGTGANGLMIKFDTNLNILTKKYYGGGGSEHMRAIAIDSDGNFIIATYTSSLGANGAFCIVKTDSDFNVLVQKYYDSGYTDTIWGLVIDSNDNIFVCGTVNSMLGGQGGSDGLMLKVDKNLNKITSQAYYSNHTDNFHGMLIDSQDNIYCYGDTWAEGTWDKSNAWIIKFDNDLTGKIIGKVIYLPAGGESRGYFKDAVIDSSDVITIVGSTQAEGPGNYSCIIYQFDSNLNKIAGKVYGGTGIDRFQGIGIDSDGNFLCCGYTTSTGGTDYDTMLVKFDANLNFITSKVLGGSSNDEFNKITLTKQGNIICTGYSKSEGAGSADTLITIFPKDIPAGTFTGSVLTGFTLEDSALTLSDSTQSIIDSTKTFGPYTLNEYTATLSISDSNLTQEKEIFG